MKKAVPITIALVTMLALALPPLAKAAASGDGAASRDASADGAAGEDKKPALVSCAVAELRSIPDEVSGFGSLSYQRKVDIGAPCDGVIESLPFREGDDARRGDTVARIGNPLVLLAVDAARNGVEEASSALALAVARLREGRFSMAARLMSIEKLDLEITEARRQLAESERKARDQERLLLEGAVTEEAVRALLFSVETARAEIVLMERERGVELVGLRDEDLLEAGMRVPEGADDRRGAIVELGVAALEAERRSAAAALEAARNELKASVAAASDLVVRAPSGGTVGARYVEEGERVRTGDKIVTLMDTGSLYAIITLCEADTLRVAEGMRAFVSVDALAGARGGGDGATEDIEGVVDLVYPMADSESASFTLRIVLSDGTEGLRPGMFARARVVTGSPVLAVMVPSDALVAGPEGSVVFAVEGGVARERPVAVGKSGGDGMVAVGGLAEGAVVIRSPDSGLKEGDRVEISD